MAPRKSQKDNTQGYSRGPPRKRARRDSSLVESQAHYQSQRNVQDSDQDQVTRTVPELISRESASWSAAIDSFEREPMSSQVQRYKDWRRNGSPHEETCRVCLKPGDLYPCRTCRPAFHPGCIPDGSLRDPQGHLFCALCVRRGWNVAPPALTPPPTPGPAPARQLDATAPTTAPAASAMSIPSLVTVPLENNTQRQFVTVQQAQELAGSVSSPNPTDYHALQPQPTTINLIGQSNSDVPNDGSHRNTETSRPKRQRKSRFATLPSEVDASLAVLYRELESVASLKTQVEDLQIQNIQYLQGIKIRDNNLAVLRRDLENRKAENEELARLRANTSEHDSLKAELEELRSKNAQLEADLQVAREQTATAQELVNDWKGKLTQLIGIS